MADLNFDNGKLNPLDLEEFRKRYYEPYIETCRLEWEQAANKMDEQIDRWANASD